MKNSILPIKDQKRVFTYEESYSECVNSEHVESLSSFANFPRILTLIFEPGCVRYFIHHLIRQHSLHR